MAPCIILMAAVVALWSEVMLGATAAEYFSRNPLKLNPATMVTKSDARNVPYVSNKDSLWSTMHTSSVPERADALASVEKSDLKNPQDDAPSGGSSGSPDVNVDKGPLVSSYMVSMDPSDTHVELPSISILSPMESLKQIWRGMIAVPPSATQLDLILKGAIHGYETSMVQTLGFKPVTSTPRDVDASTSSPPIASANSILNTTLLSNQYPLRANGTHKESLYRQVLSQFLDPLASDGKRSLWLDQELVLKLKGSVVFAHHPELWRDIGEGLKPKLNRGVRLLTPYSGTEEPPGMLRYRIIC